MAARIPPGVVAAEEAVHRELALLGRSVKGLRRLERQRDAEGRGATAVLVVLAVPNELGHVLMLLPEWSMLHTF